MMQDAIKNFHTQFAYEPEIINSGKLKSYTKYVVLGMGGSHLAADLIRLWDPCFDVLVHSDYGLPVLRESEWKNTLVIVSSYSGNTEEPLDGFRLAQDKNLDIAVIAVGGELLRLAKEAEIPYIELPDTGIQPRSALGFSLKAFFKLLGEQAALNELTSLADILNSGALEREGKELAALLKDKIPVIYVAGSNEPIAYNWKIKLNETGKIPAFYNIIPELNHNEMTGFDVKDSTRHLSERFHFLFLRDNSSHARNQRRMEILKKLYEKRGLSVTEIPLNGRTLYEKVFNCLILADWTAYYIAENYGLESEQVPMVEEFKKMVA